MMAKPLNFHNKIIATSESFRSGIFDEYCAKQLRKSSLFSKYSLGSVPHRKRCIVLSSKQQPSNNSDEESN